MDISKLLMTALTRLLEGDTVEASWVFTSLAEEVTECECPEPEEILEAIILVLQENSD